MFASEVPAAGRRAQGLLREDAGDVTGESVGRKVVELVLLRLWVSGDMKEAYKDKKS